MRKWNIFGLFVLLLTVLTACNQAQIAEQATKNASVTTKAEMDAEEAIKEAVPEADTDSLIVSTTAELISSITPDAHIILKSGTYNFSALTEAEIAGAGAYVDPDLLTQGEFFCLYCSRIDSGGRKERICAAGYGEWVCGCDDSFVLRWCSLEGAGSGA